MHKSLKIIRKPFVELSESQKKGIDQFIDLNGGLVFHYTKLNEIVSEANNTEFSYIIAYYENKIIGVCPVHRIRKGLLRLDYSNNGSYEIPYGGWVFNMKQIDIEELWNRLPIAMFGSLTYCTSFVYKLPELFNKAGKKFETGVIDLSLTIEEIWHNNVQSEKRNKIRKAEKSGIIIKNQKKDGFLIFYNLMQEMRRKAGLNDLSFDYYEKILCAYFPDKAMVLIAYQEEKPLTGVVILGNKNVMHYWQGASTSDVPNLGQGELLQWEAIKWAKNQGTKYYDLCVIEPERLPRIAQFKMGFTKELMPFYYISKKTFFFKVLNKIQNVFNN